MIRKIIHIDMDAFYASVEQRDHPELKGKPLIVGGNPKERGVVATCSYEARKFGIHSAMSCAKAYRLCPHAVFMKPDFDKYKTVSGEIRRIFLEYTDLIEPLSLDEAYLDVTVNKKGMASATMIAKEIKQNIYEKTCLTASAGVSFNKFLAKTASDINKPNGITVITPEQADSFIEKLPIRKFFGVGEVTEKKMIELGIKTGADLRKVNRDELIRQFGKTGSYFYDIAHGKDDRPVKVDHIRKSIGRETTLLYDIDDRNQMIQILEELSSDIEYMLKKYDLQGMTVTLKIKYYDFQSITRGITFHEPVSESVVIMGYIRMLLLQTEAGFKKVRLLGITVSNLINQSTGIYRQLPLPF